ncbi:MAG: Co2+/Mg2+ efflux protein ApaG [Oceanospirillaceae bacterium]|nr:Co2+/Mg2+ efflux protein ApaG [Oceanospirillaceae bacterium]
MHQQQADDSSQLNLGKNIEIVVESKFEAEQSDAEAKRFVFTYSITIKNKADFAIQLLSRRWVVTDGNHKQQEIQGEGVIGVQPVIDANSSYQYSSGAILETDVGSMFGHYNMVTAEGVTFKAEIAAFTLAKPNTLH